MRIKINKNGILEIERKGKWAEQLCPFSDPGKADCCGHWCPLFEEPVITDYCYQFNLCRKTYKGLVEDFTDERP